MSPRSAGNDKILPVWVLAVAVLAIVGGILWTRLRLPAPQRAAIKHREIALRVLAEHLADRFPRAKALVIGNPFAQRPEQDAEIQEFDQAAIRGLELGFNSPDAVKVAYPGLRPDFEQNPAAVYVDPRTTTPLSFLVALSAFEELAKADQDRTLVVSLIGLPVHIRESPLWAAPDGPRFGLLLPDWRMVGDSRSISQAFKSGKIAAAILNRPGAPTEETPAERDYRAEFERRFLLVTPENADELLKVHPQLF